MSPYIYSPVVKGKANDLRALHKTEIDVRKLTKALIDVRPVSHKSTVDLHIEKTVSDILILDSDVEIFVDFYGFLPGETNSQGKNAVLAGYSALAKNGRKVTPVYGFDRDEAIWPYFSDVIEDNQRGFCFRLEMEDLDDESENTWQKILTYSSLLGLSSPDIDLYVDLRDIRRSNVDELQDIVTDFLALCPKDTRYRSICVAGSSASKDVTIIAKDSIGWIYRNELKLWARLKSDVPECDNLVFGDYGIVHPDFMEDVPCGNTVNCKIRYTAGDKILVFRGHVRSGDSKQTHALAQLVVAHEAYRGWEFSAGDDYIYECAKYRVGPGNPGNWVFADLNHHIVYTARQIRRLNREIEVESTEVELDELLIAY